MSGKFKSFGALKGKVEWEGGVSEAITGYGISTADLPDGVPAAVVESWDRVSKIRDDVYVIETWLESVPYDDEDDEAERELG